MNEPIFKGINRVQIEAPLYNNGYLHFISFLDIILKSKAHYYVNNNRNPSKIKNFIQSLYLSKSDLNIIKSICENSILLTKTFKDYFESTNKLPKNEISYKGIITKYCFVSTMFENQFNELKIEMEKLNEVDSQLPLTLYLFEGWSSTRISKRIGNSLLKYIHNNNSDELGELLLLAFMMIRSPTYDILFLEWSEYCQDRCESDPENSSGNCDLTQNVLTSSLMQMRTRSANTFAFFRDSFVILEDAVDEIITEYEKKPSYLIKNTLRLKRELKSIKKRLRCNEETKRDLTTIYTQICDLLVENMFNRTSLVERYNNYVNSKSGNKSLEVDVFQPYIQERLPFLLKEVQINTRKLDFLHKDIPIEIKQGTNYNINSNKDQLNRQGKLSKLVVVCYFITKEKLLSDSDIKDLITLEELTSYDRLIFKFYLFSE